MKDWFKYKYGFINIDTENIFFTNTGNWSETKDLQEKGIQQQNKLRMFRMKIIPFALIIVVVALFLTNANNGKVYAGLIMGLLALAYSARNYLKSEIGSKFKLPIAKILNITINTSTADISFIDGEGNPTEEKLENLDKKGIKLLTQLKEINL